MAEIDFTKYDEVNKRIDDAIMAFVRQHGLLNPNQSVGSYKRMFEAFARQFPFNNDKEMQFGILYHQMKNIIESLKAKISELQTQRVLLENDVDLDSSVIAKIDNKIEQAQELLATALARFEKYSEAKVGDKDVMMIVAKYKAACLEDRIFSHVIGQSMMPRLEFDNKYPGDIVSKYEKYQELLGAIDKKEPGIRKFYDYMMFMREKDEKARSNRYLIRMLEKDYADSPVLATPNYQKGKNTRLDMSRYRATMELFTDLPMKEYEIAEFVLKSHIMDRKDDTHEIN